MAEPKVSNLDRLGRADVGDASQLDDRERELIDKLTEDEVDTLIRIREKLGAAREDAPYSRMRFPF
jgi:hypothetical protein